jgi:hypothetical protein
MGRLVSWYVWYNTSMREYELFSRPDLTYDPLSLLLVCCHLVGVVLEYPGCVRPHERRRPEDQNVELLAHKKITSTISRARPKSLVRAS